MHTTCTGNEWHMPSHGRSERGREARATDVASERRGKHEGGTCRGMASDRAHTPWRVLVRSPSDVLSSATCKDPDPITLEVDKYEYVRPLHHG